MTDVEPAVVMTSFDHIVAEYVKSDNKVTYWDLAAQASMADAARASAPPPAPRPRSSPRTPKASRASGSGGLPFTVRAVLQLALDLDVPTPHLVYTALWAPVVAADMELRDSKVAYLSRETLATATGMQGTRLMNPGGVVERAASTVGIVRMVTRGVPGAIPLEDGDGWRGEASSWTVTGSLDDFTHVPARTAETPRVVTDGRALQDGEVDLRAVAVWLNPLHPWWGPQAAGATGMRAIAALIARYGWVDLLLSATDVAAILGAHRQTAWRTLTALADLGLAQREGKRGRWRLRLASRLGQLTADDVKYNPRRPSPPSAARAKIHDWSWFSREGRALRARARSIVAEVIEGWDFPGDQLRLDTRTGRPWGMVIWVIEQLRHYTKLGQDAAKALLGPLVERMGAEMHRAPATRHRRSQGRPGATSAPPAPAVVPAAVVPKPREEEPPPEADDGLMIDGFPVDQFGRPDSKRMSMDQKIDFLRRYPKGFPAHLKPSQGIPGVTQSPGASQAATAPPGGVPGPRPTRAGGAAAPAST